MKRMLILIVVVSLVFSFLFAGCDENGAATAATAATDDELTTLIMASLVSSMLPMMFAFEDPALAGDYGPGDLDGMIVSGSLNVTAGTFTFTDCALDVDDTAGADLILNEGFSLVVAAEMTITNNDFNLIGIMPGSSTVIDVTVTEAFTITAETYTLEITMSGLTDPACNVVVVLPLPLDPGPPTEVTSATIDGVDYAAEFQTVLTEVW